MKNDSQCGLVRKSENNAVEAVDNICSREHGKGLLK